MKNLILVLAVPMLVAGCGGGGGGSAAPVPNSLPPVANARADGSPQVDRPDVDAYVQDQLLNDHAAGASVVVMHDGQVVYAKSYGYADTVKATPMRPETRMDLGSIFKQFVAAGVLMQVEAGQLSLDDKIAAYLGSDGPPGWSDITIRQVLSHTAGIVRDPDDAFFAGIETAGATTEDAMLAKFRTYPLLYPPGTQWAYSNVGYQLLGFLLSRVTGQYYGDFLQQRIFTPLGMSSVRFMDAPEVPGDCAIGYELQGGDAPAVGLDPGLSVYFSNGESGIQVSALDMAKWDAALDAATLLTPASQALMWSPAPSAVLPAQTYDFGTTYGFGWFLGTAGNGVHVVSHSGGMPGFSNEFMRWRETRWSVMVMTNLDSESGNPEPIAIEVGQMFGAAP